MSGGTGIHEIWISKGKESARVGELLDIAEERAIPVFFKNPRVLDDVLPGTAHQGIMALAKEFAYTDLDRLINRSMNSRGRGLLIAADHITDEGNMGALIRTAVFFGAQGLILPRDRSAKVTQKVMKRSSGAYIHIPVARVVNLARTMDILKEKGFWIIGTTVESPESIYQFDWNRDIVLILGSEDKGMSRSVRAKCHQTVGIPSAGPLAALNISVACGIILSEISRQRRINQASAV